MGAEDHSGTLKVVAGYANGLRLGKDGRKPNVVASIRMLAKKQSSSPVSTTQKPDNVGTCDPTWDETFMLTVADLSNSQMEVTLWDMSEENPKNNSNFLGTTIPVEGDVSGKLFLTLRYSSASGGSAAIKPIGVTLHMEKPWEEIKPQKYVFEKDLLEDIKKLLSASDARVEVVGTERGKGERLSHETATLQPHFLAHINIHPSADNADTRTPNDLVAILREMMEKKKQGLASPYPSIGLLRDLDVHEPYRKIDPATNATKTPATRAPQPITPKAAPAPVPVPVTRAAAPVAAAAAKATPTLASMLSVGGTLALKVSDLSHLPKMDMMKGTCDPFVKLALAGQEKQTKEKKGVYDCNWNDEPALVFNIPPIQSEKDLMLKVTVHDWDKFTSTDVVGEAHVNILALLHPSAPSSELLRDQSLFDVKKKTPVFGQDKFPTVFSLSSSWTPTPKPAAPITSAVVIPDPTPTPPPPAPKPAPPPPAVVMPTPPPPAPAPVKPQYIPQAPAPAPAPVPVIKPPPPAPAPVVQPPVMPQQPPVAAYTGGNIVMDVKKEIAQLRSRQQGEAAEAKRRTEQEEERVAIAAEEEQKRALAQLSQLPRLTPPSQTTLANEQAMQTRASISSVRNLMLPSERTDAFRVKQEADASIQSASAARQNCENARSSMAAMLQQARVNALKGGGAFQGGGLGASHGGMGGGGMREVAAAAFSIKLRLEASQLLDRNAFFEEIKLDLGNAVNVDARRFTVQGFGEVGFLVLDISLASAPGSNATEVVEQLRRQSFELESPLQRGQHTSKILAFTVPQ